MKVRSIFVLAAGAALAFSACSPAASTAPSVAPSTAAVRGAVRRRLERGRRRRRPPRRRPSACSSSGRRRRSSPATSPPQEQGYYAAENLTVNILPGGPNVIPQAVGSQANGPEFTISWVPKVLEAREQGSDLVDIAQVFQRSGTLSVSWVDDRDHRSVPVRAARRSASGTSATSTKSPRPRPTAA